MKCWWTMPRPSAIASWVLPIVGRLPKTSIVPLSGA
jgi:hypothetical protein